MEDEKTGSGSGSGSFADASSEPGPDELFDHERLDVYRVAREFFVLATEISAQKIPSGMRDQFDRAALSILANIAEGAGKTAKNDKRRFYEIARGSTTETATHLDVLRIRGYVSEEQFRQCRPLLIRVSKMLSRLCAAPGLR